MSMSISNHMSADHRRCDEIYAQAEQAVADKNWDSAATWHRQFIEAMQYHFTMEEEILFPRFEEVSGMTMGPTQMMRHEHQQMRQLFAQMDSALKGEQRDDYLGAAETLLIMMQQHNAKEEQILYPMTDQTLASESAEMVERLSA